MPGLGDGFSVCSWGDEWPNSLRAAVRRVLRRAGVSRTEWFERGLDVHHVVAAGLDGAAFARSVMGRWQVNVHDVANAAVLPRRFHQGRGLHRQSYLDVVNRRLMSAEALAYRLQSDAGFNAARLIIVKTIQSMANQLVFQSGDAVVGRLQATLQEFANTERPPGPGGSGTERGNGRAAPSGRARTSIGVRGADRVDETSLAARRPRLSLATAFG